MNQLVRKILDDSDIIHEYTSKQKYRRCCGITYNYIDVKNIIPEIQIHSSHGINKILKENLQGRSLSLNIQMLSLNFLGV